MQLVVWQQFQEKLELIICHCLDNELPVVAEEEKTSTGASTLTRLEDHVTILLRAQTREQHVWRDAILLLDTLEVQRSVHSDVNDAVNHFGVFALLDFSLFFQNLLTISQAL